VKLGSVGVTVDVGGVVGVGVRVWTLLEGDVGVRDGRMTMTGLVDVGRMMMKPIVGVGVAADAPVDLATTNQIDAARAMTNSRPRACLMQRSLPNACAPVQARWNGSTGEWSDCRLKWSQFLD